MPSCVGSSGATSARGVALRVVMLTGEASGDMLAASLAGAMRELLPGVEFEGIGGERMAAAGFRLTVRTTGWSSISSGG